MNADVDVDVVILVIVILVDLMCSYIAYYYYHRLLFHQNGGKIKSNKGRYKQHFGKKCSELYY